MPDGSRQYSAFREGERGDGTGLYPYYTMLGLMFGG